MGLVGRCSSLSDAISVIGRRRTVKQHLAALRMLLDWLVIGHVIDMNPAHAVRGPKHVIKKGRTPVLTSEEARALLAAINTGSLTGLRDRALIGTMIYTFARMTGLIERLSLRSYFLLDLAQSPLSPHSHVFLMGRNCSTAALLMCGS